MNRLRSLLALTAVAAALLAATRPPESHRPVRVVAPAPVSPSTPASTPPPEPPSADFAADVRLLFRVIACAKGAEPLPPGIDQKILSEHCRWLEPRIRAYRRHYLAEADHFLARLRPPDLPATLVYPFGGGDLLSALTTYPEARQITTLSLEHAGDPRRLRQMDRARLARNLAVFRKSVAGLLCCNDSTSESLMQMEQSDLPSQLSFFLIGLALHDFEPVGLRYFTIQADGTLHYLTDAEIARSEGRAAKQLNRAWLPPSFSVAFSNCEIEFRRRGDSSDAGLRVHRHIAANLSDQFQKKDDRLILHLAAQGPVSAMTKAASYCLWNPAFSRIRDYLLDHMVFMISDSTGIPVRFSRKAGFVQETYGRFTGPFLDASPELSAEFVKLWRDQPRRPLSFRYGYIDAGKHYHLLVTRRPEPQVAGGEPVSP